MNQLPFRQIHLDFHTSELLENVGEEFDPVEFAQTLQAAHVNSVTLFARCHHGMLYYDSKLHPECVHPGLADKNLLHKQIAACRAVGIRTPIYTTVQWDYHTAKRHSNWISINAEGKAIAQGGKTTQAPFDAGFYETLCLNTEYRAYLRAHLQELMQEFDPVDGLFLDIVFPVDCACPACVQKMLAQGLDPTDSEVRLAFSQQSIDAWQAETTAMLRAIKPDMTIFYNRGHVGIPHRAAAESFSHFELESLPSGFWGYLHFPCTVRYARTLGKEYLAQTGKFHTMWGDFCSYKNKAALEFECFNMLALGAKCLIGDQLEPCGRLTPAVYELVGGVYAQIEEKEPWCENVIPVVEIGLFTPEEFASAGNNTVPVALQGAVRMLQECALQFDILDSHSDFAPYKLLILPDEIQVNAAFAQKLEQYLANGGKVIATGKSGLLPDESAFALDLGAVLEQQPTDLYGNPIYASKAVQNNYVQYILPHGEIGQGLPETWHVMYLRGVNVSAAPQAETLAALYASVFDRDYRHFCSHRQSPRSEQVQQPGILRKGNAIYFSSPVFLQYHHKAPLWCKTLMRNAIAMLLGTPLVTHNGPSTVLTALNDQSAHSRRILHLLHYIPERRCEVMDIIEDVIPLHDLAVEVYTDAPVTQVLCQPQGTPLSFTQADGRVSFVLPKLCGHQMIELSNKGNADENKN